MIDEYDRYDDLVWENVYDVTETIEDGIRRVECTVEVPEDLFPPSTNKRVVEEERIDYAIGVADGDGGLPDWVRPCAWYLVWDNGNEVRIMRESRS